MHIPFSIINFTPDSFSDGGKFFSSEKAISRIKYLKRIGVTHFDIGAQSTAPFNNDVGENEEISRLEKLFSTEFINEVSGLCISIDTFRPAVIEYALNKLSNASLASFIWNDISGKVDEFVFSFLKKSKSYNYVMCHNLVPSRDSSCNHMDYVVNQPNTAFLDSIKNYFAERLDPIPSALQKQIVVDTCFGFSKSVEQNYFLIKNHSRLENAFPYVQNWMVGVSRKSFLKNVLKLSKVGENKDQANCELELAALEVYIVNKYFKRNCNYYIRSHVPENFIIFDQFDMILDN